MASKLDVLLSQFPLPPTFVVPPARQIFSQREILEEKGDEEEKEDVDYRLLQRFVQAREMPSREKLQPLVDFMVSRSESDIERKHEIVLQSLARVSMKETFMQDKTLSENKYTWLNLSQNLVEGVSRIGTTSKQTSTDAVIKSILSPTNITSKKLECSASYPDVRLGVYKFQFKDSGREKSFSPGKKYRQLVTIFNVGIHPASFQWKWIKSEQETFKTCHIECSPTRGTVQRKEDLVVEIVVELYKPNHRFEELLILEVLGGYRLAAIVELTSVACVFGVDPNFLPMCPKSIQGKTVFIPRVLDDLATLLMKDRGLFEEGIFRKPAAASDIDDLRHQLNSGTTTPEKLVSDSICAACMIKAWFREMPCPILSNIPTDELLLCSWPSDVLLLLEKYLPRLEKDLFVWLMALLHQVVKHQDYNRMSAHSCAIILVPNLLLTREIESATLLKIAQHLATLLTSFIAQEIHLNTCGFQLMQHVRHTHGT